MRRVPRDDALGGPRWLGLGRRQPADEQRRHEEDGRTDQAQGPGGNHVVGETHALLYIAKTQPVNTSELMRQ